VYWNQGNTNNVWVNLIGETSDYSATSYMATSVIEGETYQFKIRANNRWGWGEFSSVTTILAAKAPSQVASPSTAIDSSTGGVSITWTAPASNGSPITAYTV
jgi:large repetitive protein